MLLRTEGIVLKSLPYGEADLIVTYLTLDHGLRKAFARSPRKTKSRFGSSLEPFTHARIAFMGREDAALPRLTQSDIVRPYQGLREEYSCFLRMAGIAELTLEFLPEGEREPEVFHLLVRTLNLLETDCSPLAVLAYKVRFLQLKGYLPRLIGCGRCGTGAQTFYVSQGSVLCGKCAPLRDTARPDDHMILTLTPGSVRLFETLQTWELEKLGRIRASEAMLTELTAMLDAHVEHTSSRPLRTTRTGQPAA